VWEPPPPSAQCRLHVIREAHGEEVAVKEKGETMWIFGDDEQHLRLVVGEAVLKCGMVVHATNFPRLFLLRGNRQVVKDAQRPLPDHEFSATLHFKQQAGWLVGHFQGRLEQYVGQLLYQRCEADRGQQELAYADLAARQVSHRDAEAIALGGGRFALPAGEAWRRYRCRPIQVQARNERTCYDALPVDLAPEDVNRIRSAELDPQNHTGQFFLAPGSRVVTTVAAEVPCSALLAPVYQNLQGRWVQATPALMPSPPPTELQAATDSETGPPAFEVMPDFATRGLYSPQQLDEVQRRRRVKRQIAAAESQLEMAWERARRMRTDGSPRLTEGLLADVGIPPTSLSALASMAGSTVYSFLQDYGTVMAALTGTYIMYRWLMAIWHALYRCFLPLHGYHGWGGRVAGALCPWATQAVYEYRRTAGKEEDLYVNLDPLNDPSKPGRYSTLRDVSGVGATSAGDLREPPQQLEDILARLQALEGAGTTAPREHGFPKLILPKYHLKAPTPIAAEDTAARKPGHSTSE
jgi:hypothetical protein